MKMITSSSKVAHKADLGLFPTLRNEVWECNSLLEGGLDSFQFEIQAESSLDLVSKVEVLM